MKQNFLISNKAIITGRKVKIPCRNSYERKQVYEYAEKKGLKCRSIIDYTQIHVNQNIELDYDSRCCHNCDRFKLIISGTPYSFIEINSETNEKQIIGIPESLPSPLILSIHGAVLFTIKRHKIEYKNKIKEVGRYY